MATTLPAPTPDAPVAGVAVATPESESEFSAPRSNGVDSKQLLTPPNTPHARGSDCSDDPRRFGSQPVPTECCFATAASASERSASALDKHKPRAFPSNKQGKKVGRRYVGAVLQVNDLQDAKFIIEAVWGHQNFDMTIHREIQQSMFTLMDLSVDYLSKNLSSSPT